MKTDISNKVSLDDFIKEFAENNNLNSNNSDIEAGSFRYTCYIIQKIIF